MKKWHALALLALISSCQNQSSSDQIVSQKYVHKYGFETSEADWEAREKDGQIVTMLKNGVKVTQSFENGLLHGLTTYTFPHSGVIEKQMVYDLGTLLKESINDPSGMPIKEEVYEFNNRIIVTTWDEHAVPLCIEEYDDELLVEGQYFTVDHELESEVRSGSGERIRRDRSGLLIARENIQNGEVVARTTYHPNGNEHTISHYHDYQLHGSQLKFTASGKPLMELTWNHGVLDGTKTIFRNGSKVAIIPYIKGHKHGTEIHYDDLGNLTAEIEWKNDKKHGPTRLFSEEGIETEWFFKGQSVNAEKFYALDAREQVMNDFRDQILR